MVQSFAALEMKAQLTTGDLEKPVTCRFFKISFALYNDRDMEKMLNNKSYKLLLTISVAGLLLAAVVAGALLTDEDKGPENRVAPDFSLILLNGENFQLSAHKGKPLMINFFASWCLPCREEIPALVKIQKEYEPKGVAFLAVAIDDAEEDVKNFIERLGFTFPVGHDKTGAIKEAFGVYGLPTSFFISKESTINYFHPGGVSEALLRHELDKLL